MVAADTDFPRLGRSRSHQALLGAGIRDLVGILSVRFGHMPLPVCSVVYPQLHVAYFCVDGLAIARLVRDVVGAVYMSAAIAH